MLPNIDKNKKHIVSTPERQYPGTSTSLHKKLINLFLLSCAAKSLGLIEGDFAESQGPDTSTQDSAIDHFFVSFEK